MNYILFDYLIGNFKNVSIFNYIILFLSTIFFISSVFKNRKANNEAYKSTFKNKKNLVKNNSSTNISKIASIHNKTQSPELEQEHKQEKDQEKGKEKREINSLDNNHPISSDEETSSSPQLNSKSFLSPLNFTTGKKKPHSKKKQSYYVSTYFSSCQAPDQSTIMDGNDEQEDNSSPEFQLKHQHKLDLNSSQQLPQQQQQQQHQQLQQHTKEEQIHQHIEDHKESISTPTSSTINFMQTANNSHLINESLIRSDIFIDPNINSPTNISLDQQETCTKKIKKRKCILPQVLELRWKVSPKKVLIIKKFNDEVINDLAPKLAEWLESIGIQVIKESDEVCENSSLDTLAEMTDPYSIDFIISLGGDGTILHTSSLFKTYIPPILSFSLGSLGFLTAFDYQRHREYIQSVIDGKCYVSYRLRLSCTVISGNSKKNYQVLNEVSIDRGTNPYLSNLECSCDDKLITIVQADGLIIATSTGSTAYSLSAGGSLVHPTIPAVLITPICPHTLSFRPVILPSTSTLTIRVPEISRCSAWASFDGKSRQELKQGDRVIIKTSKWAVPVVCKTNESCEWFEKLADNLNWNVRMVQKSLKSSASHY